MFASGGARTPKTDDVWTSHADSNELKSAYLRIDRYPPSVCIDRFGQEEEGVMRAAVVRKFGGPEAVEVMEVPLPEPGFFEVRVKVAAAALNPADAAVWSGYLGSLEEGQYAGLGLDAAGTVDAVGAGITLEVGTPVIVFDSGTMIPTKAQAEYVVSDLNSIAPAPAGMDLTLASTIPLNAMTASLALDHLRLRPRDTLLVTGAARSEERRVGKEC